MRLNPHCTCWAISGPQPISSTPATPLSCLLHCICPFVRCPERFPSLLVLFQTCPFLTCHLFCLKVPRSCRANSCPRQLQAGSGQSLKFGDWHNVTRQLLPLWLRREEFSGTGLWLGSFQICWTCLLSKPIQLPMKQLSVDSCWHCRGLLCLLRGANEGSAFELPGEAVRRRDGICWRKRVENTRGVQQSQLMRLCKWLGVGGRTWQLGSSPKIPWQRNRMGQWAPHRGEQTLVPAGCSSNAL